MNANTAYFPCRVLFNAGEDFKVHAYLKTTRTIIY